MGPSKLPNFSFSGKNPDPKKDLKIEEKIKEKEDLNTLTSYSLEINLIPEQESEGKTLKPDPENYGIIKDVVALLKIENLKIAAEQQEKNKPERRNIFEEKKKQNRGNFNFFFFGMKSKLYQNKYCLLFGFIKDRRRIYY